MSDVIKGHRLLEDGHEESDMLLEAEVSIIPWSRTYKSKSSLASSSANIPRSIGSPRPRFGVFWAPSSTEPPSILSAWPRSAISAFRNVSGLYANGRKGASCDDGSVKAAIRDPISALGIGRAFAAPEEGVCASCSEAGVFLVSEVLGEAVSAVVVDGTRGRVTVA